MIRHPVLSAVLVVIAGTVATWAHYVGRWVRRYDDTMFHED